MGFSFASAEVCCIKQVTVTFFHGCQRMSAIDSITSNTTMKLTFGLSKMFTGWIVLTFGLADIYVPSGQIRVTSLIL